MYKLLIADDDYEIRNGLCKYFPWDSLGYTVVSSAENGKQAYDFISKNKIDVILCDIKMPIMNGLELAEKLKIDFPSIYIVFYSAYEDFRYAQSALESGVKSYIIKSTNYNEIIRIFSNIKKELDNERCISHPESEDDTTFNEKIINTMKEYIDQHYNSVTLEDLAELVHMNPDYVSKFFKKHSGMLFSQYLTQIRMNRAAELLNNVKYAIYEVSEKVGYSNSFNFTKAFKNYFGISPRDYRNSKK